MFDLRPVVVVVFSVLIGSPVAQGARPRKPNESEVQCALRVIRSAAAYADRQGLDALRRELLTGSVILPNDRPALEPVQLMLVKALTTAGEQGLDEDELIERMDAMGFLIKIGRGRGNRGQVQRRSVDQIRTLAFGMSSRSEGEGYYVRADFEKNPPRFYATALADKELGNVRWFLGKVRGIADRTRRAERATTIRQWGMILRQQGVMELQVPEIGKATAVVLAHMSPGLSDYVTNIAGDAVYGDGLGTPSDTSQVYKILQELHNSGLAEREYREGARIEWRACSTGYVGSDTARGVDKLQAWSTVAGEQALAQWFRFHYAVLEAKAPRR